MVQKHVTRTNLDSLFYYSNATQLNMIQTKKRAISPQSGRNSVYGKNQSAHLG